MGASLARGAPGGGGLALPGVLGGVGFILPEQGLPCPGQCGGNAPRPARPGGIPCRDGGGGMRASSCLAEGNPPHPEGGGEWEGSAVDREGGPVLSSGALAVPGDAEGRAAPAGYIRTGMLSLECCRGDTSSIRCRKDLGPGCFCKIGSRGWITSSLRSCEGSLGCWIRMQW